jgi:hypothetical protein
MISTVIEFAASHVLVILIGGLCLACMIGWTVKELRSLHRSRQAVNSGRRSSWLD